MYKNFFIFVEQFLNEYDLSFQDIEEFNLDRTSNDLSIIFFKKENKINKSVFKNLSTNYILVSDVNDEFLKKTQILFFKITSFNRSN